MQVKTILNRVQKHASFVYGTARLVLHSALLGANIPRYRGGGGGEPKGGLSRTEVQGLVCPSASLDAAPASARTANPWREE